MRTRSGFLARSLAAAFPMMLALVLAGCGRQQPLAPDALESTGAASAADFNTRLEAEIRSESGTGEVAAHHFTEITGPTIISEPGAYRVTQDFNVSQETGDGVVIRADHVFLSLGGHTLTGPGPMAGRGVVLDGVEHVLVTHGTLRNFGVGAALIGANRSAVRRLHVEGSDQPANPPGGIPPQIGILLVNSAHNFVLGNGMPDVNLGIFVRGSGSFRNLIARNRVVGGEHGLLGICYNPAPGEASGGPSHDRVWGNSLVRFGTGIQVSAGSAENTFARNTIHYFDAAWEDANGTNHFVRNRTMQISP